MNRRRFLVALAALPIAAKFGGLIPAMPTTVTATVEQYSDFINFGDPFIGPVHPYVYRDLMSDGEVGRIFGVHIEESSDVPTHLA